MQSPHIALEAYERLLRGFVDAFSEVTIEVLDLIDAGEHVMASTVIHGRIGAGDGEVTDTYVFVYKLRDGRVVEGWEYRTKEEALEAVGSSASNPSARLSSVAQSSIVRIVECRQGLGTPAATKRTDGRADGGKGGEHEYGPTADHHPD